MTVNCARRLGGCIWVSQVTWLPKVESTIGATECEKDTETAEEDERNTTREPLRDGSFLSEVNVANIWRIKRTIKRSGETQGLGKAQYFGNP